MTNETSLRGRKLKKVGASFRGWERSLVPGRKSWEGSFRGGEKKEIYSAGERRAPLTARLLRYGCSLE